MQTRRKFLNTGWKLGAAGLFVPTILRAQSVLAHRRKAFMPAASGACTVDSGDDYNQSFEAGTQPTGWTNGTGTPDYGAARPGTQSPTQLCSKSLRVTTSASKVQCYYDYGSGIVNCYTRFYLYVDSGTFTGNLVIASGSHNSLSGGCYTVSCYDNGSNTSIRLQGASNTGWLEITIDAWNRIETFCIQNSTLSLRVNGNTTADATSFNNGNQRYFFFGPSAASTTMDIYFDEVAISSTGWIGAP